MLHMSCWTFSSVTLLGFWWSGCPIGYQSERWRHRVRRKPETDWTCWNWRGQRGRGGGHQERHNCHEVMKELSENRVFFLTDHALWLKNNFWAYLSTFFISVYIAVCLLVYLCMREFWYKPIGNNYYYFREYTEMWLSIPLLHYVFLLFKNIFQLWSFWKLGCCITQMIDSLYRSSQWHLLVNETF